MAMRRSRPKKIQEKRLRRRVVLCLRCEIQNGSFHMTGKRIIVPISPTYSGQDSPVCLSMK